MKFIVDWPRYPTVTSTGRESHAKQAGRLVPWLSANVVNNLPAPVYRDAKIRWREAAVRGKDVAYNSGDEWLRKVKVYIHLYKATAQPMDPFAVLEGVKPICDALAARLRIDDACIIGGFAVAQKAATRQRCRVEIEVLAA